MQISSRDGSQKCFSGSAPEVIDDDVETSITTFASKGFGQILAGFVEADGRVGSQVVKSAEYLFVSSGGDHPSSAEELGRLYGQLSGDSGRTKDFCPVL
jgi:hypothetical protein